uniref:Uncharacterized protein n=1 Tax=viral metagenome TaxID=1070528 RepID=A0A6M3KXL1_9ZZZZ
MKIEYVEQRGSRESVWVGFEPEIVGGELRFPAHTIYINGEAVELPAETLTAEDNWQAGGILYLAAGGVRHWVSAEAQGAAMGEALVEPFDPVGPVKPRILRVAGETVYVLRSVE